LTNFHSILNSVDRPYTPGGCGTSIATSLEGGVRLEKNPPVPGSKFVEASGKVMNTTRRAITRSSK
jgi:hypothetical protein